MTALGRCLTALAGLLVLFASPSAHAQCSPDQQAPSVTASNVITECSGAYTLAFIGPQILDNCDPLPQLSFDNAFFDVDPDGYPIGQHFVTVTGTDSSGNTNDISVAVKIQDTTEPSVSVGVDVVAECLDPAGTPVELCNGALCNRDCGTDDNCPGSGTCGGGGKCTCATAADCPLGNSCKNGRCSAPFATDTCTPTSSLVIIDDAPALFPRGTTVVNLTALDIYGNVGTGAINVVVNDISDPVITNLVDFAVAEQGNCDAGTGPGSGTLVTLPVPNATDACTPVNDISVTNSEGGSDNEVCLKNGELNTITWTALDSAGNDAEVDQSVVVGPPSGTVTLAVNDALNGWDNDATADVDVQATGATLPITWVAVGATAEITAPKNSTGHTFFETAVAEGEYCPLYISLLDGGAPAQTAVDDSACFGIDRTEPSHDFSAIPTEWVDAGNPGTPVPVDPANPDTWPVFTDGELLELRFAAHDIAGSAQSGVAHVEVVVDPGSTDTVVYDLVPPGCPPGGAVSTLDTCPTTVVIDGCNTPNDVCLDDGRLNLQTLGGTGAPEEHEIAIRVTDLAGNLTETLYYIKVGNLSDVLQAQVAWATGLGLTHTAQLFGTADLVLEDSPGHAFLLARSAFVELDAARGASLPVELMQIRLAHAVVAEARRLLDTVRTLAKDNYCGGIDDIYHDDCNWLLLEDLEAPFFPLELPTTSEDYYERAFLRQSGQFEVDFGATIDLAQARLNSAQDDLDRGDLDAGDFYLAIEHGRDVYDAMVMLFDDRILAEVYNTSTRSILGDRSPAVTMPESFYRGTTPGRFADTLGRTVAQQTQRFVFGDACVGISPGATCNGHAGCTWEGDTDICETNPTPVSPRILEGLPGEVSDTLLDVWELIAKNEISSQDPDSVESFVDAVNLVRERDWEIGTTGFDNGGVTRKIYMNAVEALELLRDLQGNSVYTHYWQAAIALTVAFVINFSLYEGPANLVDVSTGSTLPTAYPPLHILLNNDGSVAGVTNLNDVAQSAECRFSRYMYALADGRLEGNIESAVDLITDSKCMVLYIYNTFYAPGPYMPDPRDPHIPWDEYGCVDPATANACDQNLTRDACVADAKCAWADYGSGLQCQSVNYQEECNCISDTAPDDNCNGIDEDCDGVADDDFVETACGWGPCESVDACINGTHVACVPDLTKATADTDCDNIDDDCDGIVDDDYVAATCGVGGCARTSACTPCAELVQEDCINTCTWNGGAGVCKSNCAALPQVNCNSPCTWNGGAGVCESNCAALLQEECKNPCTWNYETTVCEGEPKGEEQCRAATPGDEICDGKDNNCNWVRDEFLDSDQDGYGCDPAHPGCDRMKHCRLLTNDVDCNNGNGCAWFPAAGINCTDWVNDRANCLGHPGCAWDGNETVGNCDVAPDTNRCIGDCANINSSANCNEPEIIGCVWDGADCVSDCAADSTGVWDCDDTNPASNIFAAEICDNQDNDCNYLIDDPPELVKNDCGNCEPTCETTCYGSGGPECDNEIPFNPTPGNSDSIEQSDCRCDADCGEACACDTDNACQAGCDCDTDCTCECDVTDSCDDGSMTITSSEVNVEFAWVSNDSQGTVSKVDTSTGQEVGRYCAALGGGVPVDQGGEARGLSNVCGQCGGCNRPSRSAVDLKGNVFIGNRAFNYQGSVTKIANVVFNDDCTIRDPGDCYDFDGDGTIETSCDLNGDGIISTNQANGEYLAERDECILWTRAPDTREDGSHEPMGVGNIRVRAVTIDAEGDVWVGNWEDAGIFEINPDTGRVKRWVYLGANPYGAVIDNQGILYVPNSCCGNTGQIVSYNTTGNTITMGETTWAPYQIIAHPRMPSPWGHYGIAVDGRNRVWIGGYVWSSQLVVARFDPADKSWGQVLRAAPQGATLEQWLGNTATLSAWIRTQQQGAYDDVWRSPGLTGVQNSGNNDDVFWGFIENTGRLGIAAGAGARVESINPINDNNWHHVAMTRNHNSGEVELFVDGVSQGTAISATGQKATRFYDFGRIYDTSGSHEEFDGLLDEIRVTSAIRSADWIAAEHLAGTNNFIGYAAVESAGAGWWHLDWKKRLELTFDNSGQVTDDLVKFPVLVVLNDGFVANFDYADFATDGADLRFVDSNGDELPFEIEAWGGGSASQSFIWVRVPHITAGSIDESIFMYFDNDEGVADAQEPENVWDLETELVFHLNDNPDESTDAGVAAVFNGGPTPANGLLGRCYDFDGSDDYLAAFVPISYPVSTGQGRGVTVDGRGIAWVAQHGGWTGGRLTGYEVDSLQVAVINGREMNFDLAPGARIPIGVGVGYGGNIWTANQSTWNMTVLNPQTGTMATFPVGGPTYTYSDFTGNLLRTFTAPQGSYGEIFEGCLGNDVEKWVALYWEGVTPFTTDIGFRVRVADTQAALPTEPWYPDPGDPDALYFGRPVSDPAYNPVTDPIKLDAVPAGAGIKWIQVQAVLISDDEGHRPTLSWFKIARDCLEL